MLGLTQETPLLVPSVIDHAASYHGDREIVSRLCDGTVFRTNYARIRARSQWLAKALDRLGIGVGDKVATLAWNTHRHLETIYAVAGLGAVHHTVNARLSAAQITYIVNHAQDRLIFIDETFLSTIEALAPQIPTVKQVIVLCERERMPASSLKGLLCYEEMIARETEGMPWRQVSEHAACGMSYTSGTTSEPKGVLYSHRATLLNSLAALCPDGLGFRATDAILPAVPLYHANGWSIPYSGPIVGAKLVLPGPQLDASSLLELIESEGVSILCGVPTILERLIDELRNRGRKPEALRKVFTGGSAVSRSTVDALEDTFGIEVVHAWGMTELSPFGTFCVRRGGMETLEPAAWRERQLKQGRPIFTVEMKITDEEGRELPWDGTTFGILKVRGPGVLRSYFRGEEGFVDEEGWFDTGDVATIDSFGFMKITDRRKDVIKSGSEWISSIDLENIAKSHPNILDAAVVGVAHPKWTERPLLVAVAREERKIPASEILAVFEDKVPKWWIPDDVVFIDEIPRTPTGKVEKTKLRAESPITWIARARSHR